MQFKRLAVIAVISILASLGICACGQKGPLQPSGTEKVSLNLDNAKKYTTEQDKLKQSRNYYLNNYLMEAKLCY